MSFSIANISPNLVNLGSGSNTGTGDPLQASFAKLNYNDTTVFNTVNQLSNYVANINTNVNIPNTLSISTLNANTNITTPLGNITNLVSTLANITTANIGTISGTTATFSGNVSGANAASAQNFVTLSQANAFYFASVVPQHVQSINALSATHTTLRFPSKKGNLLLVSVSYESSVILPTISDNIGTTYSIVKSAVSANVSNLTVCLFSGLANANALANIVVSYGSGSANTNIIVSEFLHASNVASNTANLNSSGGFLSVTSNSANELVYLTVACAHNTPTYNPPAGFINDSIVTGGDSAQTYFAILPQASLKDCTIPGLDGQESIVAAVFPTM